jgi:hypothetical protein
MSSEPAEGEGVVGKETWDDGDGVETRYETSKSCMSAVNMAYVVLHFIPGGRQIILQLVCHGSAKISAFVVCGGGCLMMSVERMPLLLSSSP